MDLNENTINTLFAQLALDSDDKSIDAFVAEHRLKDGVKLIDADFWTPTQAAFLKEELHRDAEWATVIDALNVRLHDSPE